MRTINSFGRRHTRKLSNNAAEILSAELVKWQVDFNNILAQQYHKLSLEIGFGDGNFMIQQAKQNPDQLFIGAEVFDQGLVKSCRQIKQEGLTNIRIWPDDALKIIPKFNGQRLFDTIFILYPDPWPKLKHHKRRIINANNLTALSKLVKSNGNIIMATDHVGYANHIANAIEATKALSLVTDSNFDFSNLNTKYQNKALASSTVYGFEVSPSN